MSKTVEDLIIEIENEIREKTAKLEIRNKIKNFRNVLNITDEEKINIIGLLKEKEQLDKQLNEYQNSNKIANLMISLSILIYGVCFILGIYGLIGSFIWVLVFWGGGFILGSLFVAVAEIIKLLEQIKNQN